MGLLAAALPPSGAPAPLDPVRGVEVEIHIIDGTASTEVRRTVANARGAETWFEVVSYYPSSALPARLAVLHAGAVVEEAAVGGAAAPNGSGAGEAWLAALPDAQPEPLAHAKALAVAVRVPPNDAVVLVVGWAQSLRAVRGAYRYALPLAELSPSDDFSLHASVYMAAPLAALQASGPFNGTLSGVGERAANFTVERTSLADTRAWFHLNFTPEAAAGHGLVSSCAGDGGGYFSYTFFPGSLDLALEPLPKSISFAIDFSGSMAGDKASQAKAAFGGILLQLAPFDRFEVLRFDSRVTPLTSGLEAAASENISRAIDRIEGQVSSGSTNLGAALDRALADLSLETDSIPMLVLMTDGNPTVGLKTSEELLALAREKNQAGAAIHTLALGLEASVDILEALSAQTGGTHRFIDPAADVVQQVADFYSEVSQPLIENLTLTFFEPAFDVTVPPLSVLYGGSDITAHGRLRPFAGPVAVSIEGRTSKGQFSITDSFVPERTPCNASALGWALSALEGLLDWAAAEGATPEVIAEIVNLSEAYQISTPWTPFRLRSGAPIPTEPLPKPPPPPDDGAPAGGVRTESPGVIVPLPLAALIAAAAFVTLAILWRRARPPDGPDEA